MKKKKKKSKRYKSKRRIKKISTRRVKRSRVRKRKKKLTKSKRKKRFKNIERKPNSKSIILKIIKLQDKLTPRFSFNFNLDKAIQGFFQKIADKIDEYKAIKAKENEKKRLEKVKQMQKEKTETVKKLKLEKQLALEEKQRELREEIKLEKERKKDLQKFIRMEQALLRKEQAEKQRKFLAQIKLEKRIEQFRKREALEIKNLEKFVLSQERESYSEVEERVERIKQKYQALRDQKIRERVEQLGVTVEEGDDRSALLEKERQYNIERQKIEFALESYFRSAHSAVFQINKRWIPKYLSIMRVIDRRFETGEIFIKWDDSSDEDWLMLIYIKDNNPDSGIVVEDKTNSEKNISTEYKASEIFKFSDALVDSLTQLLDRERKKRKVN
tara:strand:- start:3340 stop:4497 length:1158 start_codon:yes stop_codon:yes gene_type:complete